MKVQDFEKAIDALSVRGLDIDEVKMKADDGRQVRQVIGHFTVTVVWDETGRAFTAIQGPEDEELVEFDGGAAAVGRRLKRDAEFDLRFD